jgi:hypothetical protein
MDAEDILLLGGGVVAVVYLFPNLIGDISKKLGNAAASAPLEAVAGAGQAAQTFIVNNYNYGAELRAQAEQVLASQEKPLIQSNYGTAQARTMTFNPLNIFKPFSVFYVDPVTHRVVQV